MGPAVRLVVTAGPHAGREFTFDRHDTVLVGRAKDAHLRLSSDDPYFSRRHFLVEVNPPRCRLLDLVSRNGTHVNGCRVEAAELADGDEVRAGHTVFVVRVAAPPADAHGLTSAVLDFEQAFRAGGRPRVEDYLPPGSPRPVALVLALVLSDVELRGRAGEAGPADDYVRRFPELGRPDLLAELQAAADLVATPNVPGYDVGPALGRGAMGVVYRAARRADGRAVAVKVVTPAAGGAGARSVEKFVREARVMAGLSHPNVIAHLDSGTAGGRAFLVMELVDGPDAGEVLRAEGPLPVRVAARIGCGLLAGLAHAHAAGVVHRDVKPSNVLLAGPAADRVAKVGDFGLARAYDDCQLSGLTMQGDVGGTPAFMAPEQVTHFREARPAADQYSAAATLYNLLTGRYLHDLPRGTGRRLAMIVTAPPVPIRTRRPDLPETLAAVLHRALAREPDDRFPDASAFRAALLPFTA